MIMKTLLKLSILLAGMIAMVSCSAEYATFTIQKKEDPNARIAKIKWVDEDVTVAYYTEGEDNPWLKAANMAYEGNWTDAVDAWIKLLEVTKLHGKRISAEYNIALGCYVLDQKEIARKWMEQTISDCGSNPPWYVIRLNRQLAK